MGGKAMDPGHHQPQIHKKPEDKAASVPTAPDTLPPTRRPSAGHAHPQGLKATVPARRKHLLIQQPKEVISFLYYLIQLISSQISAHPGKQRKTEIKPTPAWLHLLKAINS